MDKMAHFFECLLPISICNLECEYCYLIQQNRRKMKNEEFSYSVKHMIKALTVKRLGGICYFSLCGTGETMLQKGIVELVEGLLREGHYVNITTNGTITNKLQRLTMLEQKYREKVQIAFSFHYIELKKKDQLKTFFDNVKMIKAAGISILVQLNLYDGYINDIELIKKMCIEEIGAMPQVALTRKENGKSFSIMSEKTEKEYHELGRGFESPLFEFTFQNFNVRRKEFCYAGDWSAILNMKTGIMSACYGCGKSQNIFENLDKKICFEAIGHNCKNRYCINSSHFMALGVIPKIETPTYVELRNREEAKWYSKKMEIFLSQKFSDSKKEYGIVKKIYVDIKGKSRYMYHGIIYIISKVYKGIRG